MLLRLSAEHQTEELLFPQLFMEFQTEELLFPQLSAEYQTEKGDRRVYRFFTQPSDIHMQEGVIRISGDDVNHIRNVLRMKRGEQILVCTGLKDDPAEYLCEIDEIRSDEVTARILDMQKHARELPAELYLFQAIPKGDRFETVIQKCVELGVHEIVPVFSARTIVKLDDRKAEKKAERWRGISLAAAKQSKRSIIPDVRTPLTWKKALEEAAALDKILVPYENAKGIAETRRVFGEIQPGEKVGIFIGPEGGFEETEITQLRDLGAEVITLGHRILRTDTASIAILAMLMLQLETDLPEQADQDAPKGAERVSSMAEMVDAQDGE